MRVGELNALIKLDGKSKFDADVDSSGHKFQALGTTAAKVGQGLATTTVAAGAAMLGLGAAAFKTGVSYNALQQSSRAALTTLLGSAEKANAQMDLLDDFASNSPFAKDVFIRAQQQLIGFGIAAQDVIPILGAVQDATAAVGGTNQDISDIVTTLSKISSTGKITAQDLNELGNKGIDAAGLIGAEFGKSGGEIRSMITNSEITAQEAIDAITNQMSSKFGGAAANVKETWVGATDRIKAAFRDIGSALATPFIDPNGGGRAITWANDVADVMRALQKQVAPLMDVVMTRWGGAFDKITPSLQNLKDRIDALDMSALNEGLDALDGYGPIIAGLAGAFTAWGTATLPIIGGINPIVAGVTALVLATPELRDGLDRVMTAAAPLVGYMGDLGVKVADLAMTVIDEFAPAFFDLAESVVEAAVPLAGPLTSAIGGLLTLAEPFVGLLADVVELMAKLPDGVLLAGTAFMMLKGHSSALKAGFETLAIQGMLVGDSLRGIKADVVAGNMAGLSTKSQVAATGLLALETGARRVGTALKTAFVANAPALAIAGLVTVIGAIAGSSREAQQYVDDLANSFDKVTGAATDATNALISNKLEEEGILEAYQKAGGDVRDFTVALTETGPAADAARERIEAWTGSFKDYGNAMNGVHNDGERYQGVIDGIAGAADEAREKQQRLNAATSDTDGVEDQIAARERLIDIMDLEVDALQKLIEARREERGEALSLAEAQIRDAEAREKMIALAELEGEALDATGDKFDAYSEKGRAAIEATRGVSDSMNTTADSMAAAGESTEAITAALNDQLDAWIENAVAMGVPEEKARELAETYGLIPTDIATEAKLETDGVTQSLADLKIEIDETTGEVTIDGNPAPGEKTLAELIGNVNEETGTVTINGNEVPAWLTVDALTASILSKDDAILNINATDAPGRGVLNSFGGNVRATEEFAKINATDQPARNILGNTRATINQTWGYVNVGAKTNSLQTWINSVAGKVLGTSYIQIRPSGGPLLQGLLGQADGGVVDYYAGGGIRENHVAQIAPAGAWRVWAEPETEGEAYIPLALSKRSRSESILAEVADRFGMMLVKSPVTSFADGGTTANSTASRPAQSSARAFPSTLVLRVGEREFTGYIEEIADGRPAVRVASEFISQASRARKARY